MQVVFHRTFAKQYKKLPSKVKAQFSQRLTILLEDRSSPLLRLHKLSGTRRPLLSINVNADYRALFYEQESTLTFVEIGTHAALYG